MREMKFRIWSKVTNEMSSMPLKELLYHAGSLGSPAIRGDRIMRLGEIGARDKLSSWLGAAVATPLCASAVIPMASPSVTSRTD
jgi:hypothetical protein